MSCDIENYDIRPIQKKTCAFDLRCHFGNTIYTSLMTILRSFLKYPTTTLLAKFIRRQSNIALPFLYKIEPKCRSCGIKLQTNDPTKPGYFIQPNETTATSNNSGTKYIKYENKLFDKLKNELPPEDQDLLLSNTFNTNPQQKEDATFSLVNQEGESVREVIEKLYTVEPDENSHDCIRCRQMTYNSNYEMNPQNYPIDQLQHVLHNIPIDAPLVYLFSASDFPIGIDPGIFKFRKPGDIYFIMTKADNLIEKTKEASQNYTKQFIQDYLHTKYKLPRNHVFVSLGKDNWSCQQLYHFIPNGSYIIGNTNCGKSTLIKSLLLDEELQKKKQLQLKSKHENVKLPPSLVNRMKQKFVSSFMTKVGPGISYLPGFTRDVIPVEVGLKLVYDVPGFNSDVSMHQLYNSFKSSKDIHRLIKGAKTFKSGMYKSPYVTIKGPQVINLEGLGFLQLPKGGLYQLRNITNLQPHVFSDILKTKSVLHNGVPQALESKFALDMKGKTLENSYDKYLIPPFYGTIDLVIENFGYLNLKPVGTKRTNELMKLYLHPGVNAIIRDPIANYIAKTFSGKDRYGNPVSKDEYFKKSRFHLIRYKGKHPIYSQLCPVKNSGAAGGAIDDVFRFELVSQDELGEGVDVEQVKKEIRDEEYRQLNEWVGKQSVDTGDRLLYDDDFDMDEQTKYKFWKE